MCEIGFGYGALCDPLEVQAQEQGYTLGDKAERFDGLKKDILTLLFNGILTESQVDAALKKLNSKVVGALKKMDGGSDNE